MSFDIPMDLDVDYLIEEPGERSHRYLEASEVKLPSRAPRFVEEGHCQWCNKPLGGRARLYCQVTPDSIYRNVSECAGSFLHWWCSRPAYVRATFIRDNFTCRQCGLHPMREDKPWLPDISQLEGDHIIPMARGGKTELKNLQTLCWKCNRRKGVSLPTDPRQGRLELFFDGGQRSEAEHLATSPRLSPSPSKERGAHLQRPKV